MADIKRIKGNIRKMLDGGASEAEIDQYIGMEGVTLEQLQAPQVATDTRGGEMGPLRSGINSFAQGATFGHMDEVAAALKAPFSDRSYEEIRDEYRRRDAEAAAVNPGATMTGEILGGLAGTAVGGAGLGAARGLGAVQRGMGVLSKVPGASTAARAIAAPATTKGKIMRGMAAGAGGGALGGAGFSEGETAGEVLGDVATGAAVGGVLGGAVPTAGRALRPFGDKAAEVLTKEGVRMTPGQILGGAAKRAEESLMSIPLMGSFPRGAAQRSIHDFNRAAYGRVLAPLGETVGKNVSVGRDAISKLRRRVSKEYDAITPKLSAGADEQFVKEMTDMLSSARGGGLTDEAANRFDKNVQNIVLRRLDGGASGEDIVKMQSELKDMIGKVSDREHKGYLEQLNSRIDDMLMRQNPEYADQLRSAHAAYANLRRVEDAATRPGGEVGVFTPQQLRSSVRMADKSAGRNRFAGGHALLQDLAEAGEDALPQKLPDSGTAERGAALGLLGGAGFVDPMSAAAATAATVLPYSRAGQALARGALLNRPQTAQDIGRFLMERPGAAYAAGILPQAEIARKR